MRRAERLERSNRGRLMPCWPGAPLPTTHDGTPEHVPKKLYDFFDENMLQNIDLARIRIDRTIPSGRKAR
jgi:hypothetical protein